MVWLFYILSVIGGSQQNNHWCHLVEVKVNWLGDTATFI